MPKKYSNKEVFIKNSYYPRHRLKERIINENLIKYECDICKNVGIHNNKKLVLQLDHKNGVNNDNTIENLRFLCPNCHSQTDNYAGKASKGKRNAFKKPNKNFYQEKLENDKKLWEKIKTQESEYIKFGTWGWKSRLCEKIGIKSQKVNSWLIRVDKKFLEKIESSGPSGKKRDSKSF